MSRKDEDLSNARIPYTNFTLISQSCLLHSRKIQHTTGFALFSDPYIGIRPSLTKGSKDLPHIDTDHKAQARCASIEAMTGEDSI